MKNLKIEAEKGFRRTLFEPELVDPNAQINFGNDAKDFPSLLLSGSRRGVVVAEVATHFVSTV